MERRTNVNKAGTLFPVFVLAPLALLRAGEAFGASAIIGMVCENPRREYQVTYEEGSGSFKADETHYRVLAVERSADRYIVVGLTVEDGPTFRAHFFPYKKMEFFADSQLMQTDGCR
jgi:hypothetical protein